MALVFYNRRHRYSALRFSGVVLLATALLAPKLSLAVSMLSGEGYRTVIICTGTSLARVTLSPAGEIINDRTGDWLSPQCVFSDQDVSVLERAWYFSDWPQFFAISERPSAPTLLPQRSLGAALSGRGPPLV